MQLCLKLLLWPRIFSIVCYVLLLLYIFCIFILYVIFPGITIILFESFSCLLLLVFILVNEKKKYIIKLKFLLGFGSNFFIRWNLSLRTIQYIFTKNIFIYVVISLCVYCGKTVIYWSHWRRNKAALKRQYLKNFFFWRFMYTNLIIYKDINMKQ